MDPFQSVMSSSDPDDIPGTSKPIAKKGSPPSSSSESKSQASPLPTTSNGHGSRSGATPTGNSRRRKRRLSSGDTALMGWSGEFPKLKAMASIDISSDLEPQSLGELQALYTSGLLVFPRVEPQAEAEAGPDELAKMVEEQPQQQQQQQEQQQQQSLASPPLPMMTSPVESSLSPNSDMIMTTQGREPELESRQQIKTATATSTNLTITTTTTTTSNSTNSSNATGSTATTPSPELDNQENDVDVDVEMEQPKDKQQQQSAKEVDDYEEEEEEIEPLVVAENEGSSSSEPSSASPARRLKSRKRLFSPNENKTKEEEDEAGVPLTKSPKSPKTEDIISPISSRIAKRARSLNAQNLPAVQLPRALRFSSQDQDRPKELVSSTANYITAKVPEPESKPELKPEPEPEPEPDVQTEAIPEKLSTTASALKLKATDEFYRLPFAYGWKRELVLPSTKNHKRRTGDVFFIAPNGRKLRSREDIVPLLTGELTIEHFCFQRLAQGAPPEHELVRRATPSNAMLRKIKQQAVAQSEPAAPLPITGKRVSKPKLPKGASPPSEGWTATMAVKGNSRVLANSNGSGGGSTARTSLSSKYTRKRGFMPRQSRAAAASIKTANCVYCQTPLPSGSKQGSLKTNTCQSCLKIKREKERESERSEFDDDPDDEDNASVGSLLEIGKEIKVPGQHPPAQLFSDLVPRRALREQEVVVVAGRKAIAIQADLPRPQVKLLPRQQDLTGYDQIYNKRRNQSNKARQDLMESMADAHNGCQVLMAIMKTMNLKERMNMSRVCKTWAMVGRENGVWRSVSLRDTLVQNWVACLRELARHRTRELDMMGVIMANPQMRMTGDMRVLRALRVLRTDACDADFLSLAIRNLPQLLELRATCVSRSMSLINLDKLTELRVLRIHMTEPKATLTSVNLLAKLKHLTELSLRGVTNLGNLNMLAFKELPRLEVLSLGSCQDVKCGKLGRDVLPSLKALRSFRLENDHKGMAMFPVDDIMRGLSLAGGVRRLELINVDLDAGFSPLLASCATVSDVLLIPKCMHNTANMTNAVMQAISDNAEQLKVFRLGLVTQLLSATGTLYRGTGKDVIPVRRPVPGIPDGDHLNHCSAGDSCQELDHAQCVAFLPVERLEAILHHMMPQAWLSVAKVAMCDTTKLKFLPRPEESSDEKF
ncbi:hypothetical protein M5D96_012760 [Drosophila gunungcola]|uniref:MBD domain-containing protein n=1 Tax=Drosophila gunungcola TaxID=103775 RepID=A0A9P9YCM9_9MUSC|nr:hypothetical protein M5D96_012760 [Drosophila gunungcola]